MPKPLIGVTSYARSEDDRFIIPAAYLDAVVRSGGVPVAIPPEYGHDGLMDHLDGLILSGGGDITPSIYNASSNEHVAYVSRSRDAYEIRIAEAALKKSLPTLAICRGEQIVNVAFGGTLHVHLPDHYGNDISHRDFAQKTKTFHSVSIKPDSMLADILGETEIECPSFHHQSVKDIADGFSAVAWSSDGVIEAIENPEYPRLIAVQWHPEYSAAESVVQQRLFDVLIDWAS